MTAGTQREITRDLSVEELDQAIDEAQQAGEARLVRRLCFVKNLYAGDSPPKVGETVGVSQSTSDRWARAWNEAGV